MGILTLAKGTAGSLVSRTFAYPEELDEASREAGWRLEHNQLKAGRLRARYVVRQGRYFGLTREHYGGDLEIQGTSPQGMLKIAVVRPRGRQLASTHSTREQGQLLVVLPGTKLCATYLGGLDFDCLYIPQRTFYEVEADGDLMPALTNANGLVRIDIGGPALMHWRRAFNASFAPAVTRPASRQETDLGLLQQTVTLLRAARTTLARRNSDLDNKRHAELALIREYFDANLASPIKVEDICGHAGIPVRNLQRLCKRELGLTPTQYLLARRLNAVRRQLMDSEAAPGRVTFIAGRYGFDHLGRFAVQYRTFFGETPRQTLHNTKASMAAGWHRRAA